MDNSNFKRLAKDVQYLQKHVTAVTDGQAEVRVVDDNLDTIELDILPNSGFYRGAKVRFKMTCDGYPETVPLVFCLDTVYHPNIDPDVGPYEDDSDPSTNVCVSLIDEWDPSMDLDHVVMAILFLFYNPNADDALSPYFDSESSQHLAEDIRQTVRGESLDGKKWPRLLVCCEDDDCEDCIKDKAEASASVSVTADDGQSNGNTSKETDDENSEPSPDTAKAAGGGDTGSSSSEDKDGERNDCHTKQIEIDLDVQNNVQASSTNPLPKLSPLSRISTDSVDFELPGCEKSSKTCGDNLNRGWFDAIGLGSLFTCSTSIKVLFSNFHKRDHAMCCQPFCRASPVDIEDYELD